MKHYIPCDCEPDMEHEVDVSAELGGYGIRAKVGIYSPSVGDTLPCGRQVTEADIDKLLDWLNEPDVREDD